MRALVLSANVKLLPDYRWEPVAMAMRTRLLETFGFGQRALGQPALLCLPDDGRHAQAFVGVDCHRDVGRGRARLRQETCDLGGVASVRHRAQQINETGELTWLTGPDPLRGIG